MLFQHFLLQAVMRDAFDCFIAHSCGKPCHANKRVQTEWILFSGTEVNILKGKRPHRNLRVKTKDSWSYFIPVPLSLQQEDTAQKKKFKGKKTSLAIETAQDWKWRIAARWKASTSEKLRQLVWRKTLIKSNFSAFHRFLKVLRNNTLHSH